jgi:hypothetical protein
VYRNFAAGIAGSTGQLLVSGADSGSGAAIPALRNLATRASLVIEGIRILNVAAVAASAGSEIQLVIFRNVL